MLGRERLDEALATLGALLEERNQRIGVLLIGGSSLLLLGVVERPTADVDIIGFPTGTGYSSAERLPDFLGTAVHEVGDALGLAPTWFNTGPAGLVEFGLPPGLAGRVSVRAYGGLEVHLPAIEDLVCFKLHAAVDQGDRSKHFADLRALSPTSKQLHDAARWARTHDPSPGFLGELHRVLSALGVDVPDGDL